MKRQGFTRSMTTLMGLGFLFLSVVAQAQTYYTMSSVLGYSGTTSAPVNSGIAIPIRYVVTNNMGTSATLQVYYGARPYTAGLPAGIQQITPSGLSPAACGAPIFTLASGGQCTLALQVTPNALAGNVVGGPILCQVGNNPYQCSQPAAGDQLNITQNTGAVLQASATELVLGVNGTVQGFTLPGNARYVTVTNVGGATATNVSLVKPTTSNWSEGSGSLNTGTSALVTTIGGTTPCISIAVSQSCYLTITPAADGAPTAPADSTNLTPIPAIFSINYSGGTQSSLTPLNVQIVTYGSVYQDSFIFNITDTGTAPVLGSITGTGAALADFASLAWDSSTECPTGNCIEIGSGAAQSDTLGGSNTTAIVEELTSTYPSLPSSSYPAGACNGYTSQNSYSGWYLPAICEMGLNGGGNTVTCGTDQNMQQNLVANNIPNVNLIEGGYYWSSTEYSGDTTKAWYQYFNSISDDRQGFITKNVGLSVRCVRAF
jgi:hypothetical protein